jgi:hypothetical protein
MYIKLFSKQKAGSANFFIKKTFQQPFNLSLVGRVLTHGHLFEYIFYTKSTTSPSHYFFERIKLKIDETIPSTHAIFKPSFE